MSKATFLLSAVLFVFATGTKSFSQEGEKLFKANCSACHRIGKGKLVGPDLKGVNTRYDEAWLLKWTKSSQALVKSGDKDAVAIFNEYNKIPMPDQNLSDEEIKAIYAYVKELEQIVAASAIDNSVASINSTHQAPVSMLSMWGFSGYIMIMLIGLLLIVIWVMGMSIKKLSIEIKEKNKS